MSKKEYILEVRAMTWEEHCKFEDKRIEAVQEYKDNPRKIGETMIGFVVEMMYPKVFPELTPAETTAIFRRVMDLSDAIREDEIKNLKPSSAGSTNEPGIAETAEK